MWIISPLWGSVPILTMRAEMRGGLGLVKFGWEGRRARARARDGKEGWGRDGKGI